MTETTPGPLTDPAVLVGESWRVFRSRFKLLVSLLGASSAAGLLLLIVPALAAVSVAGGGGQGLFWAFLASTVAVGAALWIITWGQVAACDAALASDGAVPGFRECARRAWPKIAAFSWVCLLYMLLVGGGMLLFFLPGLYLAAALVFAPLICLEEGLTGMAAMTRSMQYARGRWPALFGRLAILALLSALPGVVPVIGPVLSMLAAPLPIVALALLYREARRSPDETPPARWPLALAAAAWLLPIGVGAAAIPGLVAAWPEIRANAERLAALDPKDAQRLLDAVQQGKSGPETALLAAQILGRAPGGEPALDAVEVSTSAPALAVQPQKVPAQ